MPSQAFSEPRLAPEQVKNFEQNGFIIFRKLLDEEETAVLVKAARGDRVLKSHSYDLEDGEGGKARLALWNTAGEDLYGVIARLPRVVDTMEQLLGDEVYHYHSKMSMKEPFFGGAFAWHQDYGYWYNNGCLFPDMGAVMIAVDPNTRENGCLQVLRGSHKLGRIEHGRFGDQAGADPERVAEAVKRLELVYCELEPGDALFFHCNMLHRSDQNKSPNPRWSLLCCYNTRHNDPYKQSHHPSYDALHKVSESAVRDMGSTFTHMRGEDFSDPANDNTVGDGVKALPRPATDGEQLI
eukprot:jgi/Mesen1/9650/ME000671S09026